MKELDIHMMQQLHKRVHIIPVIGKADSITQDELEVFKKAVATTLQQNRIETYKPFSLDAEEKYMTRRGFASWFCNPYTASPFCNYALAGPGPSMALTRCPRCAPRLSPGPVRYTASFPLAVVASTEVITVDGAPKRVRQYPWGEVDVENPEHSNLALLRDVILRDETYCTYHANPHPSPSPACTDLDAGIFSLRTQMSSPDPDPVGLLLTPIPPPKKTEKTRCCLPTASPISQTW